MAANLPFNALRAFESAARHESFRRAADELHVTPGAVSQQIRTLEDLYGQALFDRVGRGLVLTPAGEAALPHLRLGFESLEHAVAIIRGSAEHADLVVRAPPSFASKWLVPRLGRLADSALGLNVHLAASDSLIGGHDDARRLGAIALRQHGIDAAIVFGRGPYPGCRVDKLMPASARPLCNPELTTGPARPLTEPADLAAHTLLHDTTGYEGRPDWADWLRLAGVEGVDSSRGLFFNHTSLALQAAIDGQGVVLAIEQLAADDIAQGRLVAPFELPLPLENAYYLISPDESVPDRRVVALRAWLLRETEAMRAVSP